METWTAMAASDLWQFALGAIPLAVGVLLVTRLLPCRPATRHALWLFLLLWLVAGPLLPAAPRSDVEPAGHNAAAVLPAEPDPEPVDTPSTRRQRSAVEQSAGESVSPRNRLTFQEQTPDSADRLSEPNPVGVHRSATRLRNRNGPCTPLTLAQAAGNGGSPTDAPCSRDSTGVEVVPEASGSLSPFAGATGVPERASRVAVLRAKSHAISPGLENPSPRAPYAASEWAAQARNWLASLSFVQNSVRSIPAMPTSIWLIGAAAVVLLGCLRVLRFHSVLATAQPAPGSVRRLVVREAASLGLGNIPRAYFVKKRVSPMIWCGRRARLVLPSGLWEQLDDDGRRAVVIHELAHLRRRDHWVSRLEVLVGTVYWWYPLVWWVRSRLHAEAEECCDAWVTSLLPENRRAYAIALLRTKQYVRTGDRQVPVLGVGITSGRAARFARRLKMVMTRSVRPGRSLPGTVLVCLVAGTAWFTSPARSCPDDAGATVKAAPCTSDGPVVAAYAMCDKCKDGKPCKGCKVVTKACAKCTSGKGACQCTSVAFSHRGQSGKCCETCLCAKGIRAIGVGCKVCTSGGPCKSCAGKYTIGTAPRTTIEAYKAAKALGEGFAAVAPAWEYAGLAGQPGAMQFVGFDEGDKELEERMERLEKRLAELGEQLERLAGARRGPRADAAPRAERAPRGPRAPRAPRGPRPPRAPERPSPPMPEPLFGPDADDGKVTTRSYELPEGKLKCLTALMARDDVPVLIRPGESTIEVQGTARQHRIFRAFVNMIHPEGARNDGRSGGRFVPEAEPIERAARMAEADAARRQHELAIHRHERALHAAHMAQQSQARRQLLETLHGNREQLRDQIRQIEDEADALRDRAEDLLDEAEELRESALEMREQAEELRGETSDEEDEDGRRVVLAQAEQLLAAALDVDRQAAEHESQGRLLEQRAEQISQKVHQLEEQAEAIEEDIHEEVPDSDDETESDG